MGSPIRARIRLQRRRSRLAWRRSIQSIKGDLRELGEHGWRYWIRVSFFILAGFVAALLIDEHHLWQRTRYGIYEAQQILSPRKPYDTRTTVVVISDKEYWEGELASRVPIKRTYLANIVKALDQADAAVIALDFDFSSPVPNGSLIENQDYQKETAELLKTIRDVGTRRPIVLARTLNGDAESGFGVDSDIYDKFDFGKARILRGYIALNTDLRRLPPLELQLKDGGTLDSFAVKIAEAANSEAVPDTGVPALFGSYLRPWQITHTSASELLAGKADALLKVKHRVVIVGAHWHSLAEGRGDFVDSHPTPAGTMSGAFLHANWVEALLDRRVFPAMNNFLARTLELLAAVIVAVILATKVPAGRQLRPILFLAVLIIVMSYLFVQNLGIFFDFFIPVVLVFAHLVAERLLDWREKARQFERQQRRAEARARAKDGLTVVERPPVVIEGATQRKT